MKTIIFTNYYNFILTLIFILKIIKVIHGEIRNSFKKNNFSIRIIQDSLLIKELSDINLELFDDNKNKNGFQHKKSSSFKNLTSIWNSNIN